jgi:hypothetical protein
MDRRIVFFLVFVITLLSTLLVATICMLTKQSMIESVLYTLATMWIMGVVSQLLLQNLYQAIVRPIEREKQQRVNIENNTLNLNLEEIEEINQVVQAVNGQSATRLPESQGESSEEPVVAAKEDTEQKASIGS